MREIEEAKKGEATFSTIVLVLGIACGIAFWGADIYFSYVPLKDAVGPVVAMAASLLSTPAEMTLLTFVTSELYRNAIGKSKVIICVILGLAVYAYDLGTNWAGLAAVAADGSQTMEMVRIVFAFFLAFIEFLLELMFMLVRGKVSLLGFVLDRKKGQRSMPPRPGRMPDPADIAAMLRERDGR